MPIKIVKILLFYFERVILWGVSKKVDKFMQNVLNYIYKVKVMPDKTFFKFIFAFIELII